MGGKINADRINRQKKISHIYKHSCFYHCLFHAFYCYDYSPAAYIPGLIHQRLHRAMAD